MPQKAYMQNKYGEPVDANNVAPENRSKKFFCCTKDCWAQMILCAPGTGNAYFRSKDKKKHISTECIKNSIVFNPDNYEESLFDLDFAFESMLGKNHTIKHITRGTTGTKTRTVGSGRNIRIHTLPTLYSMCISKNKEDTYNGIRIGDFFVDGDNYQEYKDGIIGYKVVETSFYHPCDKDNSLMMNYPLNNKGISSWVKIKFADKKLYLSQKAQLSGSMHIEPIIIAGEWSLAEKGEKHHSECIINKRSQIYYAELK